MEIDIHDELIELDNNPSKMISNLLKNCNEIESLTSLISHVAPKLDEDVVIAFLGKMQHELLILLKSEYFTIALSSHYTGKDACFNALEKVYQELKGRIFFSTYIYNPAIRRAVIDCLALATMADFCQEHKKYALGLIIYKALTEMRTIIFTYRPLPIERSSYFQKNTASLIAFYLWDKDVSNVLMPIHVARLVKRFTGLTQTPETIVKWLKETEVIPKEVTQKIENGEMPKKKADIKQQKLLYDSLYNEEYAAFLNSLKNKCIDR